MFADCLTLMSQSGRVFSLSLSRTLALMGEPPLLMTRVPASWAGLTWGLIASIVTSGGTRVK